MPLGVAVEGAKHTILEPTRTILGHRWLTAGRADARLLALDQIAAFAFGHGERPL